ncbi:MAG: hypothetical protein PHC86_08420 [Eubacteriales bacterium]|nr:hypothetical protein [Eubacteriales bacterium]
MVRLTMPPFIAIGIWIALGVSVYVLLDRLLPVVACRLNSRLASAMRTERVELNYSWQKWIPRPGLEWLRKQLVKAGLTKPSYFNRLIAVLILPAPSLGLAALVLGQSFTQTFLLGIFLSILANGWLTHRIQLRHRSFQLSLYKIYRFLDLQLSSGIKAMDVLRGLADAIDQPLIQPDFQRFCAQLELTLDLDQALKELEVVFSGPDMNLLASQLRNSLQTGVIGQTFYRMESLMFNRHLALIQARSRQIRTWLLLVGLLALVPIEILYVYPLLAQAFSSFGLLFGP